MDVWVERLLGEWVCGCVVEGCVGGWEDRTSIVRAFPLLSVSTTHPYFILLFPLLHSHSAQNSQVFCRFPHRTINGFKN